MKTSHFLVVGAVIASLLGIAFVLKNRSNSKPALQLYTWTNYFSDEILEEYKRATGTEVQVTYLSSNEELYAKIVAGASGYDVIMPSDYMIHRMAARGMLRELDTHLLPNSRYIDDFFRNQAFDKGLKHSMPFGRGHTGIMLNKKKVKIPEEGVSWDLLAKSPVPKYTSLLDDMREVFAMGLLMKGLSPNDHDPEHLKAVAIHLQPIKKQIAMFNSEPVMLLLKGELHLSQIFSATAIQVKKQNPDFEFYYPQEGAIVWTDNYAIPKTAPHPTEAHQFIDYFLDPERMAKCSEFSGLAVPALEARKKLPEETRTDATIYPGEEINKRLHFLEDLSGDDLRTINRLWTELKSI